MEVDLQIKVGSKPPIHKNRLQRDHKFRTLLNVTYRWKGTIWDEEKPNTRRHFT